MPSLLVRDLPESVVEQLKRRAAEHGRSAEAEHRAILTEALKPTREEFVAWSRRLQAETADGAHVNSADIVRAFRDRHGAPNQT